MRGRSLGFIVCPFVFIGLLGVSGAEQAAASRRTGRAAVELGPGYVVAHSVAVQADGRIVAAGTYSHGREKAFAVVRLTSDGRLDTTFNGSGLVTMAPGDGQRDEVSGLVIQTDGKIVVGGTITPKGATTVQKVPSVFSIVRLTASGQLDPGFGNGGTVFTQLSRNEMSFAGALAIQGDGKIVMAGSALTNHWWPRRLRFNRTAGSLSQGTHTSGTNQTSACFVSGKMERQIPASATAAE